MLFLNYHVPLVRESPLYGHKNHLVRMAWCPGNDQMMTDTETDIVHFTQPTELAEFGRRGAPLEWSVLLISLCMLVTSPSLHVSDIEMDKG